MKFLIIVETQYVYYVTWNPGFKFQRRFLSMGNAKEIDYDTIVKITSNDIVIWNTSNLELNQDNEKTICVLYPKTKRINSFNDYTGKPEFI